MLKTIKAKYADGVLVPLEPVTLNEGEELLISFAASYNLERDGIYPMPSIEHTLRVLRETAGAWEGSHDPGELIQRIYAERLSSSSPTPEI